MTTLPRLIPGLALTLSVAATPASAQHRWQPSIRAGYASSFPDGQAGGGSFLVNFALLRETRGLIAWGLEAGFDRHRATTSSVGDLYYVPGVNGVGSCGDVAPCPPGSIPVRMDARTRQDALHLSASLRVRPRQGSVRPYLAVGAGAYRLATREARRLFDRDTGVELMAGGFSGAVTATHWAPGASLGVGLAAWPGDGRLGFTLEARGHAAAVPLDDGIVGHAWAGLAAGLALR